MAIRHAKKNEKTIIKLALIITITKNGYRKQL
jgi:hypothetical protein